METLYNESMGFGFIAAGITIVSVVVGVFGYRQTDVLGSEDVIVRAVVEAPSPTATNTPTTTPTPTNTPSPSPTRVPPTPTAIIPTRVPADPAEIDRWFEQYSSEYGVHVALLRKIAVCESGYNAVSHNRRYGYAGMFQFSENSWKSTRSHMGLDENPDLRFHPEEAIRTAAFKISRQGTGAWPSCSR